jgi:DNA-binding MarR family transcriptional regulator
MGDALRNRIKQARFESPLQEAMLNLMVASDYFRSKINQICEDRGITRGQYNVLRILKGVYPDGHPRCEIASRMVEKSPDVTRLVDRLEDQGLVERDRSTEDRRLSITRITRNGLKLIDELEPEFTAVSKELSSRLSKNDCLELSRICESIYGEE